MLVNDITYSIWSFFYLQSKVWLSIHPSVLAVLCPSKLFAGLHQAQLFLEFRYFLNYNTGFYQGIGKGAPIQPRPIIGPKSNLI